MQTAVQLRGVLPVVVDAEVWEDAGEALDDIFIPDAEIWYSFPGQGGIMIINGLLTDIVCMVVSVIIF